MSKHERHIYDAAYSDAWYDAAVNEQDMGGWLLQESRKMVLPTAYLVAFAARVHAKMMTDAPGDERATVEFYDELHAELFGVYGKPSQKPQWFEDWLDEVAGEGAHDAMAQAADERADGPEVPAFAGGGA